MGSVAFVKMIYYDLFVAITIIYLELTGNEKCAAATISIWIVPAFYKIYYRYMKKKYLIIYESKLKWYYRHYNVSKVRDLTTAW